MLGFVAQFVLSGVISERRELKSSKNPHSDWRGYVLKIQTLGSTFEVDVTKELFETSSQFQELLVFTGVLVMQGTTLKLVCSEIKRAPKETRHAAAG